MLAIGDLFPKERQGMFMRIVKHLNDDWKYVVPFTEALIHPDFDDSALETVRLPHTNLELPFSHFDETISQRVSGYRKTFHLGASLRDKQALFHFEGVMVIAQVFLNGILIGKHKGGFTPFLCDGTHAVRWGGENVLALSVDAREHPDIPPFGGIVDYLTYGGIYREVRLELVDALSLSNLRVRTGQVLSDGKTVEVALYWRNMTGKTRDVALSFALNSATETILSFARTVSVSAEPESMDTVVQEVRGVQLWTLSAPVLYHLVVVVGDATGQDPDAEADADENANADTDPEPDSDPDPDPDPDAIAKDSDAGNASKTFPIDTLSVRFGFREAVFRSDGFHLNGVPLKLRGLNHHQSFPYVGYAMPKSAQYKDVDILKRELGVNMVRLSHYPHSRHFLDRCDEAGLLVFEEIPGWQHIGGDAWRQTAILHVEEMIRRDWNHPSIVLWGVRINESQDHDAFYQETNRLARELDGTRQTGGVRNFSRSHLYEDVYTFNDFVHRGHNEAVQPPGKVSAQSRRFAAMQDKTQRRQSRGKGKGGIRYLVTEHNGHMFPTKKFDAEAKRVEQALRHLRVLDAMYRNPHISGALGWCMADYNTHRDFGSGDCVCHHGVMDMFRLPKEAAAAYSSQQDAFPVMEVASAMAAGERDAGELAEVHLFTNCEEVRVYKNDRFVGAFGPDRKEYPGLPHPPIVVRDFIGALLEFEEGFSHRNAGIIKSLLQAIIRYGDKSLPLRYKLKMGWFMLRTRMDFDTAIRLHGTYVSHAGYDTLRWKFVGYRGGEPVLTAERGPAPGGGLLVLPDSETLEETETYDVCRIVLRHVDALGNTCIWSREAVRLEAKGAGIIIGPCCIPLTGGSTAFWVKTVGLAGPLTVTVYSDHFPVKAITLQVHLSLKAVCEEDIAETQPFSRNANEG